MDILGVGGWELIAIILIMLVVAGPKRMIQWSYTLGKYVSQLRQMWSDTAEMIQKEFDDAGVDVQVPKDIPNRASLNREINRVLTPVTKPFQESMEATRKEIQGVKDATKAATAVDLSTEPKPARKYAPPLPPVKKPDSVSTSTEAPNVPAQTEPASSTQAQPVTPETPTAPSNGNGRPAFGTWSQPHDETP